MYILCCFFFKFKKQIIIKQNEYILNALLTMLTVKLVDSMLNKLPQPMKALCDKLLKFVLIEITSNGINFNQVTRSRYICSRYL